MSAATYVDGILVDWGSSLFNQRPVAAVAPKKGLTGVPLGPRKKKGGAGGAMGKNGKADAKAIRSKLGSITKRTPQVMVKISGGGKGMKQIKDHLDYISRNGKLEVEDQDGNKINGREEVGDLRDEWQHGGFAIPDEGTRREAFNIVLSMPAGTDPIAVKRAARDFAAGEFEGHQYVMVLHTFDTDPDPQPSKNPHVHLCVKAKANDGTRLNPRKADLQRWREGFAEALREHGVEAAATKREQRVLRTKSSKETHFKDTEKQLVKKGRAPTKVKRSTPDPARVSKAKKTEATVIRRYKEITKALATSPDVEDRKLAVSLVHHLDAQLRPNQRGGQEDQRDQDKGVQR